MQASLQQARTEDMLQKLQARISLEKKEEALRAELSQGQEDELASLLNQDSEENIRYLFQE